MNPKQLFNNCRQCGVKAVGDQAQGMYQVNDWYHCINNNDDKMVDNCIISIKNTLYLH